MNVTETRRNLADQPVEFYESLVSDYKRLVFEHASARAKKMAVEDISAELDVTRERVRMILNQCREKGLL